MNRLTAIPLLVLLATTACVEKSASYLPSKDVLVLARFEYLLEHSGIAFKKGTDGMYSPIDPKSFDHMVSLGHEALNIEPSRSEISVESGCALNQLKSYLSRNRIFYALSQVGEKQNLITTKSDFSNFKVLEHYVGFEAECANKI